MVVGAFPAFKLAALFLKQVSKPIANYCKERAKTNPFFRTYICMPPAQFYNWCEVKAKMWVMNLGKPANVPPLSDAMAIELGANLLGEGIIFIIASGIVIGEYSRQIRKETAKENARLEELNTIHNNIQSLYEVTETQRECIQELTKSIKDLESKIGVRTKAPKLDEVLSKTRTPPPPPIPISKDILPVGSSTALNEVKVFSPEVPSAPGTPIKTNSLIHNALYYLERDLFSDYDTQDQRGLIIHGLNYLYYNSFLISKIS